ncbi:MAG: polymer-forming cytoskeletal protein [Bacteroidia bacterium]
MLKLLNSDMAKNENINSSVNLIGPGTVIKGDIDTNGDIRIDGSIEGTIKVKGKLVVGNTGKIVGDIQCQNAEVFGEILGQISVNELLSLKASAKMNGDIVTNKLSIEPGAVFSGTCKMGAVIKGIHESDKQKMVAEKMA